MKTHFIYNKYSDYLKNKYGEKVYKLPINLNVTCPNRDGKIGTGGCYFCSEVGTGFESHESDVPIREQLEKNRAYIGGKYNAKKFIAYFQNYTNTYLPVQTFKRYMNEACHDIVELNVSTRPDCISKQHLEVLKDIEQKQNIQITIELGLQTANDETLKKINRGHSVDDFINAVYMVKGYGFDICTHLILNLPWDSHNDVIKSANIMNELKVSQVKLHALYIAKNTVFEKMYSNSEFEICSKEDYINRVIVFLEHLCPDIVVQRLISRAPKEETVFCNWGTSWWKIHEEIENKMMRLGAYQGRLFINN